MLASGSWDNTVKLWDVVAQEEITTLKGHRWGAKAVSFSSDGSMLASGSGSGEIKLWEVATRENIAAYSGHRGDVDSVSFSPDGKILATGSSDTSIKLWHVPTLAEIGALKGHSHWVEEVSFSPDGAILASGAQNAVAMIWDVSEWTGERIRATTEIDLPDPNLRTAMADTLGQPSSAPIFRETMVVLIDFDAPAASISDLTGLESAINLRELNLGNNNISDISAVAGLTKLTKLNLENNNISDISPLEGLTKLTELYLGNNNISDILYPGINDIPDISPLEGLTELTKLSLGSNDISDLAPLEANIGLNDGDEVNVRRNSLSYPSIYKYIPTLQGRGVEVIFDHRVPQRIRIVSGNDQEGLPGGALANPFVVEVLDENGVAFEGVPVMFAVTSGGGTLSTTGATTDSDGRAESTLTLGQNPGTNTVEVSAAGVKGKVILSVEIRNEFDLFLRKGINLIHLPLRVTTVNGVPMTIESISDLYDVLGGAMTVNVLLTRDPAAQQWRSYFGAQDKGASGDKALTDDLGIIAVMKNAVTVQLKGDALGTEGSSEIKLHPGTNLVGVPLRDSRIARVSGLLSLEGVRNNVRAIIVSDNREFKVVGRTGDEGDIPVIGGQSFVLTAREAATIAISGEGWNNVSGVTAAAPIALAGVEAGDATPILALKGSIVSPVGTRDRMSRLQSGSGFRVILKNLSSNTPHCAPLERGNLDISYSIDIPILWIENLDSM